MVKWVGWVVDGASGVKTFFMKEEFALHACIDRSRRG